MTTTTPQQQRAPASVLWKGGVDGYLQLIDQTLLPGEMRLLECRSVESVWEAIKMLRVRGAPAIGIAAAYGVCVAVQNSTPDNIVNVGLQAVDYLAQSRPTAVNLFWALDRMRRVLTAPIPAMDLLAALLQEAIAIHEEDRQMCHAIGRFGAPLIPQSATLITHCNAGGLATAEYGTALSVMFTCQDDGKQLRVYADETRPLWQGARLTAWELQRRGIPTTVICDSMAAHVMQTQKIDAVIVGADRITARGDVANKIGTYGLAVVARHHGVPFYVAAPSSTFDLQLQHGSDIPIEQRNANEIISPYGHSIAPEGVHVYNPAFDVTPAELVSAIITEKGIIQPVHELNVREVLQSN